MILQNMNVLLAFAALIVEAKNAEYVLRILANAKILIIEETLNVILICVDLK
jgi:hypothetical protein